MHSTFRHTALLQTITPRLAAQGHDLADDWSLPSAHFIDSWCPFQCSFACVLLLNQMFWKQCTVRQYHSNLPDQSTPESRIRIWVRLRVALF